MKKPRKQSTFAKHLTRLMESNNISAIKLAKALNVSRAQIYNYQYDASGMPHKHVEPVCKLLKCTPNELFGWPNE